MIRKIIRIKKENSAFVYAIFESLEGYTSFSTINAPEANYCELELFIVPELLADFEKILEGMRKKFPIVEVA